MTLGSELNHALGAMRRGHYERLDELGVRRSDLMMGMVGITRIRRRGGLYEPHPLGAVYLVTPVRMMEGVEHYAPDSVVRMGDIVDLVAWRPDRARIYQRTGGAEWVGAIGPQYASPDPVPIWRTMLGWFQVGCEGLVLLGDKMARYRVLSEINTIWAEDAVHAAELQAMLQPPWTPPKVRYPRAVPHGTGKRAA
jgi:hypothetical protein